MALTETDLKARLEALRPAWAKDLIVAELEADACDLMTDYFATKTTRRVALCWSPHTRDLFPELRKAARLLPETADLATAPKSAEHREKYSMGKGFYLKASSCYADGWKVRKVNPSWWAYGDVDLSLLEKPAAAPVATLGAVDVPTVTFNAAKNGVEIRFPVKPARETLDTLKAKGWRWSRFNSCWYKKDSPDARGFAARLSTVDTTKVDTEAAELVAVDS